MDELDRPLPDQEDGRATEVAGRTASDERPLFSTTDDIDPEVTALEESKDDLALRGAAVSGALGGSLGGAAGGLAGHGAAIGVKAEAGEPVEVNDDQRDDRAPGD